MIGVCLFSGKTEAEKQNIQVRMVIWSQQAGESILTHTLLIHFKTHIRVHLRHLQLS